MVRVIRQTIHQLARLPYSGRPTELPGIRRQAIVRYRYIVFYAIDETRQEILILRIRHTAQAPSRHLDP